MCRDLLAGTSLYSICRLALTSCCCSLLQEIMRVLKPGRCFAGYEWCATDAYDPTNKQQKEVMAEIELGNGLPDVR